VLAQRASVQSASGFIPEAEDAVSSLFFRVEYERWSAFGQAANPVTIRRQDRPADRDIPTL